MLNYYYYVDYRSFLVNKMSLYRLSQVATATATAASRNTAAVLTTPSQRTLAGPPPPPKKLECFIDGKKVLVDPGTTVLQVGNLSASAYLNQAELTKILAKEDKLIFPHFISLGCSYGWSRDSTILLS